MMARRFSTAATVLTVFTTLAAPSAGAQTLAQRVARAPDGDVLMAYAARPDVCGDGRDVIARGEVLTVYPSVMSTGRWSGVRCEHGPVRVRLTVDGGRVTAIRTSVGVARRVGVARLGAVGRSRSGRFGLGRLRTGGPQRLGPGFLVDPRLVPLALPPAGHGGFP
jgi:hypothetical protein